MASQHRGCSAIRPPILRPTIAGRARAPGPWAIGTSTPRRTDLASATFLGRRRTEPLTRVQNRHQARRCRSSLLAPQPTVRRLASKGRGDLLSALRGPRKLRKPTSGSISTANLAWTRETICAATPEPSRTEITQTQTRGSRRRRAVTPAECTHGMLPRTSPISATSTAARSLPASSISPAVPSKGSTINTLSSLCMPGPVRRSRRTRV